MIRVAQGERVYGGKLPKKSVVHHLDEDRQNNSNSNLVICEDTRYHSLLHIRTRALRECGNANLRKCCFCKEYDEPDEMKERHNTYFHLHCKVKYNRERRQAKCHRL